MKLKEETDLYNWSGTEKKHDNNKKKDNKKGEFSVGFGPIDLELKYSHWGS